MSDTIALVRLCLIRSRLGLISGVAMLVVLQICLWSGYVVGVEGASYFQACVGMMMFPLVMLGILLFDCGSADLSAGRSGYSVWLLRSPIATWKLALVPIAMKLLWMIAIWFISMGTLGFVCGMPLPSPMPAITISAVTAWICFYAWRPFRGHWLRLFGAIALMIVSYLAVVFSLATEFSGEDIKRYRSLILAAHYTLPVIVLAAGTWAALAAVRLARTNHDGLIGETASASPLEWTAETGRRGVAKWVGSLSSSIGSSESLEQGSRFALLPMELRRSGGRILNATLIGWLPMIVIGTLLIPFHVSTVVMLLIVSAVIAATCNVGAAFNEENGQQTISSWIAASPIKSSTMAWSRITLQALVSMIAILAALLTVAGWSLWPSNRATWDVFARQVNTVYETQWAAPGVAATIMLLSSIFLIGCGVRLAWVAMSGSSWLGIAAGIVLGIFFLSAIGAVTRFFLTQKDWEGARENALYLASFLPMIGFAWLILKSLATITSITLLISKRLETMSVIGMLLIGWATLVLALGSLIHWICPAEFVTWSRSLIVVAILLPLPSILIAPVSLAWNRHR
ncbi:hypothetical protein [Stieleria varia]|uniref:Uncharacterized protein n=1 Tax=Stieleria varia TaxID=2528005 RepID=A0A5C6AYG7_9BACT|nr:hypothetical protein [Stieleria varia]TWU04461.1 hypothetical protein Pla52n_25020 [Stieleria varia]